MSTSPVPAGDDPSPHATDANLVRSEECSSHSHTPGLVALPTPKSRRPSRLEFVEGPDGFSMRRVSIGHVPTIPSQDHTEGGGGGPTPVDSALEKPRATDGRSSGRSRHVEYIQDVESGREMEAIQVASSDKSSPQSNSSAMFPFISVENNRLDRDRVMAIIDSRYMTWKHRWFCILESKPHTQDENFALIFNMTSIAFVLCSCVVFLVQSLPENTNTTTSREQDYLFWIETGCIIFFVGEAVLRVWSVPLSHLMTKFFAVDLITILGYVADLVSFANFASSFSPLRLVRVFRIFKLSRYSSNLQLVFTVLKASAPGLSMLALPLLLVALTAASIIFYFEVWDANFDRDSRRWMRSNGSPTVIQSIPDALWFSIVTMTTVGYGDIVPETPMGKVVAVVLMFTGVLTLSFPNIVLGVNLQTALRERKSASLSGYQFSAFKKVVNAVAFIRRVQYWVAISKARNATAARGSITGSSDFSGLTHGASFASRGHEFAFRANYAYFPTTADFEAHRKPTVEPVTVANLRHWTYKGVDAVSVLQVMLEAYSGVATCEEVYATLRESGLSGDVRPSDIALCLMYLAEAKIVKIFVLMRNSTNIVAALTETAVTELMLHSERGNHVCHRSAEFSRFVWKQTTGQLVPYSLALLYSIYTVWSRRERYAEDDTVPDLRTTIEMPEEAREAFYAQESFRGSSAALGRSIMRSGTMIAKKRHDSSTALLEDGVNMLKALLHSEGAVSNGGR